MTLIKLEKKNGIVLLTLNNPDNMNALSSEMHADINEALDEVENDRDARVLIITGAGKAFISGGDIKEMYGLSSNNAGRWLRDGSDLNVRIEEFPIPVIAAVNGYALGGGCELAMACDIRIASENASFAQPETGLGIIPGAGGTQRLARIIGAGRAKELIFTGLRIDAQEAFRIGLVNRVCAEDALIDTAIAVAEKIASNSRFALGQAKKAINTGIQLDMKSALEVEQMSILPCFDSGEKQDRMKAFLEGNRNRKNG